MNRPVASTHPVSKNSREGILKKTITSVIAAGALAATTMFTPTPAAANPWVIIPIAIVGAVVVATAAKAAQPAPQGVITVKATKKSKKKR